MTEVSVAPSAAGSTAVSSSVGSGFAESETSTRVTPSMSLTEAIRRATVRWFSAQPVISRAGPGISARSCRPAPFSTVAVGEAVPVRFVSQTSSGMTMASSRMTRSQSKRDFARESIVATRASWISLKDVKDERLAASACAEAIWDSSESTLALFSSTSLPYIASSVTAPRTSTRAPMIA